MWDKVKEAVIKILTPIFALFLPIFAITGDFHATGNYWWDLLIAFGISGILWVFVIRFFKKLKGFLNNGNDASK